MPLLCSMWRHDTLNMKLHSKCVLIKNVLCQFIYYKIVSEQELIATWMRHREQNKKPHMQLDKGIDRSATVNHDHL